MKAINISNNFFSDDLDEDDFMSGSPRLKSNRDNIPPCADVIENENMPDEMAIFRRRNLDISYLNKKIYANKNIGLISEEIQAILKDNEKFPLLTFYLEFYYQEDNQCSITVKNPYYKLLEKNEVDIYKDGELIINGAKIRNKVDNTVILYCGKIKKFFENGEYQIQLKESVKNYERIVNGLNLLKERKLLNENIMQMILGNSPDLSINIKKENVKEIKLIPKLKDQIGEIKMNPSQERAIKNALMYYISLVIGPPGSGKTLLLVNLVYNILFIKASTEKILICAPTNKAIDNIIILLKKLDFSKFVRVLSPTKELSEDVDTTCSVHKLALEKINNNPKKYNDLKKLIETRQKNGYLKDSDYKKYKTSIEEIEGQIIEGADIILSTINNSADERLKDYNFSYVLIDEAAQALEPEIILPLIHQAQSVVLIGDDKQLGPVIHSEKAKHEGLDLSLFQRIHALYQGKPFITLLNEQYRMCEKLYELPNKEFYGNKMKTNKRILPDENIMKNLPFPKKDFPSFFYNVFGEEKMDNKSHFNMEQIDCVIKCVEKLMENKVVLKNIGVITYYSGQKQKLYETFYSKEKYQELKIDTVDGFQGMEIDYVIIPTVRDNIEGNLGFLKSEKRLNVSLTRARKGLILIGNSKCLAKRPGIFRDIISFYCSNGLIVNDPFGKCVVVKNEEIFDNDLLNDQEEEVNEINEEYYERNYHGRIVVKKVKNEKPAPAANMNLQNKKQENININIKENNNNEKNKKNNNGQNKNNKKEEKNQIQEIKKKKKKKAKKVEEEKEEDQKEEEEENLKKKGNKKWKIKNLYCKKKNQEKKSNEIKEEEKKIEEEVIKGKKGKKNKAKKK